MLRKIRKKWNIYFCNKKILVIFFQIDKIFLRISQQMYDKKIYCNQMQKRVPS